MQLDLGPDVTRFRVELREWIERNRPPGLRTRAPGKPLGEPSDDERAAEQLWDDRLRGAGYICATWPREYGGGGHSPIEAVVLEEECLRAEVPRIERNMGERLVGPALLAHGTPEQKAHFLPRIVSGEDVYCQGYSEPDHGSDLAAIATRGVVDGDEIVISGVKTWTSGAGKANMMFILCRTDPDLPRHRGISYVLVPFRADNGFDVRPIRQISGISQFCTEYIDGARAPLFNVIGGLNNGWRPAMTTLGSERGGKGTIAHVSFENEFWALVAELRERDLLREPDLRRQLAWAYTQVSQMRFSGLRLTAKVATGQPLGPDASLTKVFRTEYRRRFAEIALEAKGAAAMVRPQSGTDYALAPWQDEFLESRAGTIFSGTSEIQRNIIAERVLGLPKDPVR